MKQRTFGDDVGMEPVVPVSSHESDLVECSDGTTIPLSDVFEDCRGGYHSNEDDRHEADVTIVREVLDNVIKWVDEYVQNTDYADGYYHIVDECSHDWDRSVEEWVREHYGDHMGYGHLDDYVDDIVESIGCNLKGSSDWEPEYGHNEYFGYSGPGCCLWGTDIGEYEEQIDVSCFDELQELHNQTRLDDVLDDLEREFCISRSQRRVKNESTGRYEGVGRKTYMSGFNGDKHPCFEMYTSPGGRYDFVVCADRMHELVATAIIDICRRTDS